jgi:hypothetical protein
MRPGGASLRVVARELRRMDSRQVNEAFRRRLEATARPYPARVRASILATPAKPEGKHTGLRERVARCVELSSGADAKSGWASVWMNPYRMLPDYVSLPLRLEGAPTAGRRADRRWRHPVYGNRDVWRQQPSHPYFYQATAGLGRAAGPAIEAALGDITRKING